jgi:hypothetical protein
LIFRRTGDDWYVLPGLAATVAVSYASLYWRRFAQWIAGIRGRDWPAVSATVDVVSVVEQLDERGRLYAYLATLTYFYRNPELQTGDYIRLFGADEEAEAMSWVTSYKGSTIKVHIDPRDPARSVLRKEEL